MYALIRRFHLNEHFGGIALWEYAHAKQNIICGSSFVAWSRWVLDFADQTYNRSRPMQCSASNASNSASAVGVRSRSSEHVTPASAMAAEPTQPQCPVLAYTVARSLVPSPPSPPSPSGLDCKASKLDADRDEYRDFSATESSPPETSSDRDTRSVSAFNTEAPSKDCVQGARGVFSSVDVHPRPNHMHRCSWSSAL